MMSSADEKDGQGAEVIYPENSRWRTPPTAESRFIRMN
jgi:hypothetical protein